MNETITFGRAIIPQQYAFAGKDNVAGWIAETDDMTIVILQHQHRPRIFMVAVYSPQTLQSDSRSLSYWGGIHAVSSWIKRVLVVHHEITFEDDTFMTSLMRQLNEEI